MAQRYTPYPTWEQRREEIRAKRRESEQLARCEWWERDVVGKGAGAGRGRRAPATRTKPQLCYMFEERGHCDRVAAHRRHTPFGVVRAKEMQGRTSRRLQ